MVEVGLRTLADKAKIPSYKVMEGDLDINQDDMICPKIGRRNLFTGLTLAVLALGAAKRALAAEPRTLIVVGDRLFIDIVINGHPVRALLDSAAELTLVDTTFAHKIGLSGSDVVEARGTGGDTQAKLANGVRISVLGLRLGPLTVALLDLSELGHRLLGRPLAVILGRELFDAARLAININRGHIATLPNSFEPGDHALKLHTERGIETFEASIEGHAPVLAAFDLGNGGPVLVSAEYAKEIGLLTDGRAVITAEGGAIGGRILRPTLRLRSLSVAGRVFNDVPAAIDATGSATKLNIGVPILRNFKIVTDFTANSLWLTPA